MLKPAGSFSESLNYSYALLATSNIVLPVYNNFAVDQYNYMSSEIYSSKNKHEKARLDFIFLFWFLSHPQEAHKFLMIYIENCYDFIKRWVFMNKLCCNRDTPHSIVYIKALGYSTLYSQTHCMEYSK